MISGLIRRAFLFQFILVSSLLSACAVDREDILVPEDEWRIPKSTLDGSWHFLKSVSYSSDPNFPTGLYEVAGAIIKFEINENTLDIVSEDPVYEYGTSIEKSRVLASFEIQHVDVLFIQNENDEDTHRQEVNTTRRPWKEREYIVLDSTSDQFDAFLEFKGEILLTVPGGFDYDAENGAINFEFSQFIEGESKLTTKYSLLKHNPSTTYARRFYPRSMQKLFGYFKTVSIEFDEFGQVTDNTLEEFMNRWDTSKKVVYYFSEGFPEHLKASTRSVFAAWDRAFQQAVGHSVLELRENSGQTIGDLRYNMIYYDDNRSSRLLGYGPSVTNPRTGEIIKGDVFLFGGGLRQAIYSEQIFRNLTGAQFVQTVSTGRQQLMTPLSSLRIGSNGVQGISSKAVELANMVQAEDLEILKQLESTFSEPLEKIRPLEEAFFGAESNRMTPLSADILSKVTNREIMATEEEIELAIFGPLVAHELGHNLGLRHNFKGTADEAHHEAGHFSSTVMEYGALGVSEQAGPGPYDRAAIEVLYSNDMDRVQQLIQENYFFCTDEHTFTSRDPLCRRWDVGSNLTDVVVNQFDRYVLSYEYANRRRGRVFFADVNESYFDRVLRYLIPFRLLFDHSNSVVEESEGYFAATTQNDQVNALVNLWRLLGQRILAPETAAGTANVSSLQFPTGEVIHIDVSKVDAIYQDAIQSRSLSHLALSLIVLGQLEVPGTLVARPDYSIVDPYYEQIELRGVLIDKFIALLMLGIQTSDPLSGGLGMSPFEALHEDTSDLFAALISNVVQTVNGPRLLFFNRNLRALTIELINEELALQGLTSAQARELIRLEEFQAADQATLDQINTLRAGARALYLEAFDPQTTQARLDEVVAELDSNSVAMDAFNYEAVDLGQQVVSTVMNMNQFGLIIPTGTGRLIRNNVHTIEDQGIALENYSVILQERIDAEMDPLLKTAMEIQYDQLVQDIQLFRRYVSMEKLFLLNLYRLYQLD